MVGNLVGVVTAHCCAELGDLNVATEVAVCRPTSGSADERAGLAKPFQLGSG